LTEQVERSREKEEDRQLSVKVSVMQPILRFLQLLCENHNKQLQNLLRWGFFESSGSSSSSARTTISSSRTFSGRDFRILRFLQLLCENHNKQLQNLLR
jgi:hypothetical protein